MLNISKLVLENTLLADRMNALKNHIDNAKKQLSMIQGKLKDLTDYGMRDRNYMRSEAFELNTSIREAERQISYMERIRIANKNTIDEAAKFGFFA